MGEQKIALMVEYLRVLGELKRSDVYCNDEIKQVLRKMTDVLNEQ